MSAEAHNKDETPPVFHNLKQIIFGLYSNSGGKLAYGGENRRPVMGRRF